MTRRLSLLLLVVGTGLLGPGAARAEAQAITAQDLLDAWDGMTAMVVESVRLMPADRFDYVPTDPLRDFADQVNHTTITNFGFAGAVGAGAPTMDLPDPSDAPSDKDSVLHYLEASFEHFRSGLETLSDDDLSAEVPWGPAQNRRMITRLKAFLIISEHLHREHGKTMIYLRENGIAPAPARGWR